MAKTRTVRVGAKRDEDIALIASGNGKATVLRYHGDSVAQAVTLASADPEDLGMLGVPEGLSIWEGRFVVSEIGKRHNSPEHTDPLGTFRQLTFDEWDLYRVTGTPWAFDEEPMIPCPKHDILPWTTYVAKHRSEPIDWVREMEIAVRGCAACQEEENARHVAPEEPTYMTLGSFIDALERIDRGSRISIADCPIGLAPSEWGSYRGYYEQLALSLSPDRNGMKVEELEKISKEALDKTFTGYKGGAYRMHLDTELWISDHGDSSGARITGIRPLWEGTSAYWEITWKKVK